MQRPRTGRHVLVGDRHLGPDLDVPAADLEQRIVLVVGVGDPRRHDLRHPGLGALRLRIVEPVVGAERLPELADRLVSVALAADDDAVILDADRTRDAVGAGLEQHGAAESLRIGRNASEHLHGALDTLRIVGRHIVRRFEHDPHGHVRQRHATAPVSGIGVVRHGIAAVVGQIDQPPVAQHDRRVGRRIGVALHRLVHGREAAGVVYGRLPLEAKLHAVGSRLRSLHVGLQAHRLPLADGERLRLV